MSNVLNESAENYLETILILSQKLPVVRSVDIANELGFKTPSGLEIANMIYERHTLLSSWLIHLGVPADVAAADACKMEHVISKESFEAIKRHVYENKEV
ncbi:MAG: DNA-binding protein [Dorea sp. 42_8]|nr:MAG: DNA-binding protein [Dorea sp. 42_8]